MTKSNSTAIKWLGNDTVRIGTASSKLNKNAFSTEAKASASRFELKMDKERFEHEKSKILQSKEPSIPPLPTNNYYRRINGYNVNYPKEFHHEVEKSITEDTIILTTGVQGIRVGNNKKDPDKVLGYYTGSDIRDNFVPWQLFFTDNKLLGVTKEHKLRAPYEKVTNAGYSFGWTKKRIYFDKGGETHHMWVYDCSKKTVKACVDKLNRFS